VIRLRHQQPSVWEGLFDDVTTEQKIKWLDLSRYKRLAGCGQSSLRRQG
jgi:hypothetical protein